MHSGKQIETNKQKNSFVLFFLIFGLWHLSFLTRNRPRPPAVRCRDVSSGLPGILCPTSIPPQRKKKSGKLAVLIERVKFIKQYFVFSITLISMWHFLCCYWPPPSTGLQSLWKHNLCPFYYSYVPSTYIQQSLVHSERLTDSFPLLVNQMFKWDLLAVIHARLLLEWTFTDYKYSIGAEFSERN